MVGIFDDIPQDSSHWEADEHVRNGANKVD